MTNWTTRTTSAKTKSICIRLPTAAPAKPNPSAQSTNRTIKIVQSIAFSFVPLSFLFDYFAVAVLFFGVVFLGLADFLAAGFITEPAFSSTHFVPAAAAPATAPLTTVETISTTASLVVAMMPFGVRDVVFGLERFCLLAGAEFLAGAFGVGDFDAIFLVFVVAI